MIHFYSCRIYSWEMSICHKWKCVFVTNGNAHLSQMEKQVCHKWEYAFVAMEIFSAFHMRLAFCLDSFLSASILENSGDYFQNCEHIQTCTWSEYCFWNERKLVRYRGASDENDCGALMLNIVAQLAQDLLLSDLIHFPLHSLCIQSLQTENPDPSRKLTGSLWANSINTFTR